MKFTAPEVPTVNIVCSEQALQEFPHLLLGEFNKSGEYYFDATFYLNKSGLAAYSAEQFLSNYFHPVSALVEYYEFNRDTVCLRNHDGHILINSGLIYLFLAYTNPDFLAYCNERIHELFTQGVSVSDAYLYLNAKDRLSPDVFKDNDDGTGTD